VDQAQNLRKMAWDNKRSAVYVTVSSGKGGVGKTNMAVNIAYSLVGDGKKVLVFDADLGLANVDVLLNVTVNKTVKDLLEKKAKIEDIIVKNVGGVDIFPASSGFLRLTTLSDEDYDILTDAFIKMDKMYDVIIFDTGAGISENVIKFATLADFFIVITQPEPTAVTDAYALMKVVKSEYNIDKMFVVINRVKDESAGKKVFDNLQKVVDKFLQIKLEWLGSLREDPAVLKAVRNQKVVFNSHPGCGYVKDIDKIASRIIGRKVDVKNNKISNFLKRFLS